MTAPKFTPVSDFKFFYGPPGRGCAVRARYLGRQFKFGRYSVVLAIPYPLPEQGADINESWRHGRKPGDLPLADLLNAKAELLAEAQKFMQKAAEAVAKHNRELLL